MTAKEELIDYILSLTPEQVDKVINRLPQLNELLLKPARPYHREQTLHIQLN